MAYIPPGAEWYLAEIVVKIEVEDDPRIVVQANLVLIHATSPGQAYEKALKRGKSEETIYENLSGKRVNISFSGLRDLNVIHDELTDGAELLYGENIYLNPTDIKNLLTSKHELGVFRPIEKSSGPDYASGDVMREVHEHFPNLK